MLECQVLVEYGSLLDELWRFYFRLDGFLLVTESFGVALSPDHLSDACSVSISAQHKQTFHILFVDHLYLCVKCSVYHGLSVKIIATVLVC